MTVPISKLISDTSFRYITTRGVKIKKDGKLKIEPPTLEARFLGSGVPLSTEWMTY